MSPTYVLFTPSLRSAHLERLVAPPGLALEVLATDRHPDADDAELRAAAGAVRVLGLDAIEDRLRADPPAVLEVTEPLWAAHWGQSQRLAAAVRPAGTRVVTYAIDNLPAALGDLGPLPDAVAFGTRSARDTYCHLLPGAGWAQAVFPERRGCCRRCYPTAPAAVPCAAEVVFAAEFSERKGIDLLMSAWEQLGAQGWQLTLLGWGPRTEQVLAWAAGRREVTVAVAAGRDAVHAALTRCAVVVLPSRRIPGWREQVGLSLVEGLAHGALLVTTSETGLAGSLSEGGHQVVQPDHVSALQRGLSAALAARGPDGTKALPRPEDDSRAAATRWLAAGTR